MRTYTAYALYPFSFSEFIEFTKLELKNKSPTTATTRGLFSKAFTQYLQLGGMPLYVINQELFFLTQLYENILYRDIISRYKLTDEKSVRELSLHLISHTATLYSYNKLKGMLHLGSMNTVKNYIQYLENSYLFFSLKRRQHEVYYHTENGLEVDFIVREGTKITQLIQVCASLENSETEEREISAILEAMHETKSSHGFILTQSTSKTIKKSGKTIHVMPVYQWLLK